MSLRGLTPTEKGKGGETRRVGEEGKEKEETAGMGEDSFEM